KRIPKKPKKKISEEHVFKPPAPVDIPMMCQYIQRCDPTDRFWCYVDKEYCRDLTTTDVCRITPLLKTHSDMTLFDLPPLGKHYRNILNEDIQKTCSFKQSTKHLVSYSPNLHQNLHCIEEVFGSNKEKMVTDTKSSGLAKCVRGKTNPVNLFQGLTYSCYYNDSDDGYNSRDQDVKDKDDDSNEKKLVDDNEEDNEDNEIVKELLQCQMELWNLEDHNFRKVSIRFITHTYTHTYIHIYTQTWVDDNLCFWRLLVGGISL
ncbi:unnamed protein product, partial [Meganyctiphanes norvegica]